MAHHSELSELAQIALEGLSQALMDGDGQGYDGLWRKQDLLTHLQHFDGHARALANWATLTDQELFVEINHALFRLINIRRLVLPK